MVSPTRRHGSQVEALAARRPFETASLIAFGESVMTAGCITPHVNGKSTAVQSCRRYGKVLPLIVRVARAIWPLKTDLELEARTETSARMWRYRLAQRYDISADDLARLLRSDEGFEFLEALMGDARPAWWSKFRRHQQIAELRRRQEETRRTLENLEREAAQ